MRILITADAMDFVTVKGCELIVQPIPFMTLQSLGYMKLLQLSKYVCKKKKQKRRKDRPGRGVKWLQRVD